MDLSMPRLWGTRYLTRPTPAVRNDSDTIRLRVRFAAVVCAANGYPSRTYATVGYRVTGVTRVTRAR